MKIIRADIDSFGKLKNVNLEFSPNLNVIYGENGTGKSTIMRFIKAAFYGFDRKERTASIPWDGSVMGGSVTYKSGERELHSSCRFGKTAKGDKCITVNNHNGEEISKDFLGNTVFEMGAVSFSKTAFIASGSAIEQKGDDEIAEKLSNLQTSGDDGVSYATAAADIDSAMSKLIAKRGQNGRIQQLETAISELKSELSEAYKNSEDASAATEKLNLAYVRKKEFEEKIKIFKKMLEAEKYIQLKKLKNSIETIGETKQFPNAAEYAKKLRALKVEKSKLEEKKTSLEKSFVSPIEIPESDFNAAAEIFYGRQNKNPIFYISLFLVAGFGILGIINPFFFIGTAIFAAVAYLKRPDNKKKDEMLKKIISVYGFSDFDEFKTSYMNLSVEKTRAEKQKAERADVEKQLDKIIAQLSEAEENALGTYGEKNPDLIEELAKSAEVAAAKKAAYESSYSALLGTADFEQLESLYKNVRITENPSLKLEEAERELRRVNDEISRLERKSGAFESLVPPCETERRCAELSEKCEKLKSDYKILEIVNGVFAEAYEIMEGEFGGKLNDTAGEILKKITLDYSSVRINKKYGVKLTEGSEMHEAANFSAGLFEQVYLSFRLAMLSLMNSECPLFADDSLMTYDDLRAERTLEYLNSCGRQVILFTCRSRDAESAKKLGANVINI